jgi:Lrp/AsnC family leucine-responsive transcriptional regulator
MIKIDKKDSYLLASLLSNCRNSDAKTGKETGMSREVVAYRIAHLEREGVITGFTTDINFNKLGFSAYSISVKLSNPSKDIESHIVKSLMENKKIVYLQKALGRYDLIGTILVTSLQELDIELKKIREEIGINLKLLDIDAFLGDYDFMPSFFKKDSRNQKEISFLETENYKIDKEDKIILEALVKDSRITAVDLSQKLKLSVFAIAHRIKKLIKNKVILAFRALVDMEKLGFHRYSILLNISNPKIEGNLVSFCRNHNLIWDLGKYTGNYNYVIEIYARNNEQFKQIIDEVNNLFRESIIDFETLIVLKELKHEYFFN